MGGAGGCGRAWRLKVMLRTRSVRGDEQTRSTMAVAPLGQTLSD